MTLRAVSSLALSAVLLTSAAPPPLTAEPQARRIAPPRPGESPVRCRIGAQDRDYYAGGRTRGMRVGGVVAPMPSIAPPAAPPPPPVMVAPQSAQDVIVTGTRVSPAEARRAAKSAPQTYAYAPIAAAQQPYGSYGNTERYEGKEVASIQDVAKAPVSTFSVDVDTGAYANVRRFLTHGQPVPAEAVRTEEMINYFRYDYPRPTDRAAPFSVTTDVARTPWNGDTRLLRIGLRGYDVNMATRPPANLVFLVDVSGSMEDADKLPLVKTALTSLADQLRPDDRVSIVVYAGAAGVVLDPTNDKNYVKAALDCLSAGGSTAGADGINLAYDIARANYREGGINRIFLATDGDFNVGMSDNKQLEALVKKNRDDGITLTTLGFGSGNYNEAMMERIADVGNGNYGYIDSAMEARKVLDDELSATLVTIAKDVKVQVEFNPAQVSQYRLIGYENRALAEEDFTNDTVDAGDIGAGHQVTAIYEVVPRGGAGWTPERRYEGNRPATVTATGGELCNVKLRYKLPNGSTSREMSQPVPASLLRGAGAPSGDMAFATAVAAFGQKLRGDKYLGNYSYGEIRQLAGSAGGYWRQEFVKLAELADKPGTRVSSID